jgi:hypothetical protein
MHRLVLSIAILSFGCSESEPDQASGTIPLTEYVPTDRNQTGTPTGGSTETEGSREREPRATVTAGAGSEAADGPDNLDDDGIDDVAQPVAQDETSAEDEIVTLTPPGTAVEEGTEDRPADALEDCTGSDNYSRCVIQRFDEGRSARTCGTAQAVYSAYRALGNSAAADRVVGTRNELCGAAGEGAAAAE